MTASHLIPRRHEARQSPIDWARLPPNPNPDQLPRFATRKQLAVIHQRYFGPLSPRTLERLPIPYRRVRGMPALYDVREFLAWAERRMAGAARLIGGSQRSPVPDRDVG